MSNGMPVLSTLLSLGLVVVMVTLIIPMTKTLFLMVPNGVSSPAPVYVFTQALPMIMFALAAALMMGMLNFMRSVGGTGRVARDPQTRISSFTDGPGGGANELIYERRIDSARDGYVAGDLSLAEYEDALERIMEEAPDEEF